jgi:hypothetical protein
MGNNTTKMSKKDTEQLWNDIKTENMSTTLPGLNSLSKDAKQLIASLNVPSFTDTETSEFNVNKIIGTINSNLKKDDLEKFNRILEQMSPSLQSDELSNTSPFISDEMYNNLVNSKTSEDEFNMVGGSYKSKGGSNAALNKSSTSSSSSTSSLEELDSSSSSSSLESSNVHEKKHSKHHEKKVVHSSEKSSEESAKSELSGGNLSYVSSSAHEEMSESASESARSIEDENNLEETSISVNTSDINMVSE